MMLTCFNLFVNMTVMVVMTIKEIKLIFLKLRFSLLSTACGKKVYLYCFNKKKPILEEAPEVVEAITRNRRTSIRKVKNKKSLFKDNAVVSGTKDEEMKLQSVEEDFDNIT